MHLKSRKLPTLFFLTLSMLLGFSVLAKPAPKKVAVKPPAIDNILKKAFSGSMLGTSDGTAKIKMVLTNSSGTKKERTLAFKAKAKDGLTQFMVKFVQPPEVKGTAFLVLEKKGKLPEQFLYIPATKIVRQVAAGNATSSFFGSDFIYADLLPYPEEKRKEVSVKQLDDKKVGGMLTYVAEITPHDTRSPYSKLVVYIEQKNHIALQIEFFDQKNKLLKVLNIKKLEKKDGQLVPVELAMKNVQTKTSTQLTIFDLNMKAKLSQKEFTTAAMQR